MTTAAMCERINAGLTGISFLSGPRDYSPLISRMLLRTNQTLSFGWAWMTIPSQAASTEAMSTPTFATAASSPPSATHVSTP